MLQSAYLIKEQNQLLLQAPHALHMQIFILVHFIAMFY